MLDVQVLSFDYQDKPVLDKVQFSLAPGQLLHLKGANGAGKTTLFKLLAGLFKPNEGEIFYEGQSIYRDLVSYQRKLCFVGHRTGLNPLLTVKENCYFDMHWGRRNVHLEDLLEHFGLQGLDEEPCYLLSAGQRRRVGLLRLMMTDAKLWLLDEPLIALDTTAIQTLITCLGNHLGKGGQVILTSHQTLPFPQPYQEYSL